MYINTTLLLGLCFCLLWAIYHEGSLRRPRPGWGKRDSFLLALTSEGAMIVLLTEGLSGFHLLQKKYLVAAWVGFLLIVLLLFIYLRAARLGLNRNLIDFSGWKLPRFNYSLSNIVLLCLVGFQLLTLAVVAYAYPPNNWDSLTYHMVRIMHWQQDQSVASYATNIARQVESQPFAEYVLANLQIMLGKDQYANFVQLFAFLVCLIGVTSITKKLGGNPGQQLLAGALSVSIPMAILQSTSTQNDLVVSQWLVCFVLMGLGLVQEPKNLLWVLGTGLSLGLACLTKATAFIFALPFCIWFGIILIRKSPGYIVSGLVIGILALGVNSGFLFRNIRLFSNPLGSTVMFDTTNQSHSIGGLASNMLRNTALNFADRQNPLFRGVLSGLQRLHQFTGLASSEPKITFEKAEIFNGFDQSQVLHEDFAGNPYHAILIFIAICFSFLAVRKNIFQRQVLVYGLCLILGFVGFSFYLKFQDFGSRLLLPLFVLWTPAIVLILAAGSERLMKIAVIGILLLSFGWTFGNILRPISLDALTAPKNREALYFANNPDLYPIYAGIADRIVSSNCHAIGLSLGENTWEYPIWILLSNRKWQGRIEHVSVNNPTAALTDKKFIPCAVISDNSNGKKKYSFYDMTLQFKAP